MAVSWQGSRQSAALDTVAVVETPEHVQFSFELAGPGRRVAAYFIDLLLRGAVFLFVAVTAQLGGALGDEGLEGLGQGLVLTVAFGLEWGYFVLLETLWQGQSIGKRALGLRVVTSDGRPLRFIQSVLRNLVRAADFLPSFYALGTFVLSADKHFRRLGDLAAGTLVIVTPHYRIQAPLRITPPPDASELYGIPSRPDLSPKELSNIELFLRRLGQYAPARELELAQLIAPMLAKRLGLSYQDPVRFLAILFYRSTQRGSFAEPR